MSKLPIKVALPEHFLEEEVRWNYIIPEDMKKVWAVELDLLAELLRVCKKHDIQIFGDAGTILGAVRHKGFIPWDDDIDLMLLRDQYDKLCEVAAKEFQEPYFFQTEYTDPGSLRGHAQLRNSCTTGILKQEATRHYSFNQGIFIDIFPLDTAPDEVTELEALQKRTAYCLKKARQNARKTTRYYPANSVLKRPVKKLAHLLLSGRLGSLTGFNGWYDKYEVECRKYHAKPSERVVKLSLPDESRKRLVWRREWFDQAVHLPFEFLTIPVPAGYMEFLDAYFGNWKTPVQDPTVHGGVIFDPSRSYKKYFEDMEG